MCSRFVWTGVSNTVYQQLIEHWIVISHRSRWWVAGLPSCFQCEGRPQIQDGYPQLIAPISYRIRILHGVCSCSFRALFSRVI